MARRTFFSFHYRPDNWRVWKVRNSWVVEKQTCVKGADPLSQIGIYRTKTGIYFAEIKDGKWVRYADCMTAIPESSLWFEAPITSNVVPLSKHCIRYNYVEQAGRMNIGGRIETAATMANR